MKLPAIDKIAVTVIPSRRLNSVKLHSNLGDAKRAVLATRIWDRGVRACQIYVVRDGQWSLLYDVPDGTLESALPWKES